MKAKQDTCLVRFDADEVAFVINLVTETTNTNDPTAAVVLAKMHQADEIIVNRKAAMELEHRLTGLDDNA